MVALTFDAGADVGFTAHILDTLAEARIKASFGITGRWAEQHPDLVRRMAADGHVIVNHSYDHRSYTGVSAKPALLSATERRADVERTDDIIDNLTAGLRQPATPSAPWPTSSAAELRSVPGHRGLFGGRGRGSGGNVRMDPPRGPGAAEVAPVGAHIAVPALALPRGPVPLVGDGRPASTLHCGPASHAGSGRRAGQGA